jgi:hypothetical protein
VTLSDVTRAGVLAAVDEASRGLPFNTAFYATIATVIPVLFLAIAVQGRLYEEIIKAGVRAVEWRITAKNWQQAFGRFLASWIGSSILFFLSAAILVSGVGGEIQAILALEWERPVGNSSAAAQGIILLTIVAGIGPILLVEKHFRPLYRRDWEMLRRHMKWTHSDKKGQAQEDVAADRDATPSAEPTSSAPADTP